MAWKPALANRLWYYGVRASRGRFEAAVRRPREVQLGLLRGYVAGNAGTAFGRAYRFREIDSLEAFRRRVPLTTWEDYEPFVERIRGGEAGVLTAEPVRRLVPTSGSTRAVKLVPYTASLRREFNAAIGPWVADLYAGRPDLMNGPAYWSITPVAELPDVGPSAVPIGFEEDSAYLGALLKPLVDATMAVPGTVRRVRDLARFRRRTLFHLLCARDLRLISVWHPSFLALLLDAMEGTWPALLGMFRRRGSRDRLAELEAGGPREYHRLWPRLGLISAWGDGHAAPALEALRRRLPGVPVQEKGLLATEAFVTIPFAGARPVAVRSHFFEFVDEQDEGVRLVDELRVGATYRVVVTTGGGLYRYQLNDRVRVTGFVAATPSLEFLGKADRVSDRFGEKLGEAFVGDVIARLLGEGGVEAPFAMLAPEEGPGGAAYVLYVEAADPLVGGLAARLDQALGENPHYAYCRRLGQLGEARVVAVREGYQRYAARCVADGQRLGNVKPTPLSSRGGWAEVFDVSRGPSL